MCTDSVVSGTEVYIDAGLATNVPSASGPVCSCRVEADPVNSINITSYYGGVPHSDCGTTLSYVVDGQPFRNVSCKDDHVDISSMNMVTNFFKIKSPYDSNYCTKIQLSEFYLLFISLNIRIDLHLWFIPLSNHDFP